MGELRGKSHRKRRWLVVGYWWAALVLLVVGAAGACVALIVSGLVDVPAGLMNALVGCALLGLFMIVLGSAATS